MKQTKQLILKVLKNEARLWNEDKTELNQTKLLDTLDNFGNKENDLYENIISLLLQEKELKDEFFIKIKDVYVFKTNDFRFFMEENKIDNSYTAYKNRIGLSDGKRFLKDTNDVVLDFPYKDCVLEGGQSSEEGLDTYFEYSEKSEEYEEKKSKRKEIFFNQVLAHDEIDRLFDKKALVNWKRYTKDGEKEVGEIKRDENGTIKENLIIKGNNLLALHSLKEQFAGKIKLIYIDPPYNTGGDTESFTYNNSFKHSTWLTFIKNRLEIGRELLKDDGYIAITIDHVELFYLGALADQIFGRENRIGLVSIVSRPQGRQFAKFFSVTTEYMLVYAKNQGLSHFNNVVLDENIAQEFDQEDKDGRYKYQPLMYSRFVEEKMKKAKDKYFYPIYVSRDLKEITLDKKDGFYEVFPINKKRNICWKVQKEKFGNLLINNRDRYEALKETDGNIQVYEKYREGEGTKIKTHWLGKRYNSTASGTEILKSIMGEKIFSYPKSLYAVQDTLKIMTSQEDIILDFFAGSGTTGQATLELNKEDNGNRKFILIEQLDEHIKICTERNQRILKQKNIDSNFIFFELAKWNETAKKQILECKSLDELNKLFDEMYDKYFLNYNLKIKEFKEKVSKEEEFKKLSLDDQKKLFIAMLDNNQMYVNETEMGDKRYGISDLDQKTTSKFYYDKQ